MRDGLKRRANAAKQSEEWEEKAWEKTIRSGSGLFGRFGTKPDPDFLLAIRYPLLSWQRFVWVSFTGSQPRPPTHGIRSRIALVDSGESYFNIAAGFPPAVNSYVRPLTTPFFCRNDS